MKQCVCVLKYSYMFICLPVCLRLSCAWKLSTCTGSHNQIWVKQGRAVNWQTFPLITVANLSLTGCEHLIIAHRYFIISYIHQQPTELYGISAIEHLSDGHISKKNVPSSVYIVSLLCCSSVNAVFRLYWWTIRWTDRSSQIFNREMQRNAISFNVL